MPKRKPKEPITVETIKCAVKVESQPPCYGCWDAMLCTYPHLCGVWYDRCKSESRGKNNANNFG